MIYESKTVGFLRTNDVNQGDKVVLVEPAYESFSADRQKYYWNCKVKLPNGTIKLAGLMDMSLDAFANKWGKETNNWVGHFAFINIKVSKDGNKYIVMSPTDDAKVKVELPQSNTEPVKTIEYPNEDINPEDIPF